MRNWNLKVVRRPLACTAIVPGPCHEKVVGAALQYFIFREHSGASRTYVGLLRGRGNGDRVAAARLLKDFAVLKGASDDSHDSTRRV